MLEDVQEKEQAYRRIFSFRLNFFFFVTFGIFTVLIVRLAILQIIEGPTLREMESRLSTKKTPIPPIRGTIYDAAGKPIAYSTSTHSLYIQLDKDYSLPKYQPEIQKLAEKLSDTFAKYGQVFMTKEEVLKKMDIQARLNYGFVPRRIKSDLSHEEIAFFLENKEEFRGIEILEESVRHYDPDTVSVQLVGYLRKYSAMIEPKYGISYYKELQEKQTSANLQYLKEEDVGSDGLELLFQEELRGKNGSKKFPINNLGRITGPAEVTNPQKGNNIYITIHKDIQLRAEQAINEHIQRIRHSGNRLERAPDARVGYVVAMEVETGKIIAMASTPDYDPNIWSGGSISEEDFRKIAPAQKNGTIREVYQSYASLQESYKHPSSLVPLGSVIKPLTVLIGLQEGLISPGTVYRDHGYFEFGKAGHKVKVHNSNRRALGSLDPIRALEKSSNAFMSEMIGNKLYRKYGQKSVNIWDKYMKEFGLGVLTESGLYGESAGTIEYFHEAKNGSTQSALVYAAFGQQGKYTALQLAQYTTMLATRGKRLKPLFAHKIVDNQGKVVKTFERTVLNEVHYPSQYWDVIERGMSKVGVSGFEGFPHALIRKTGTSQQQIGRRLVENSVFLGYAPAKSPKLAIAVVVPEGGYGARGAAPIARKIFDAYDQYYGLASSKK